MSHLDAYSDNSRRLPNNTCECGNEKSEHASACKRCAFLDGVNMWQSEVVELLRNGDMSISEIARTTGRDRSAVHKTVTLMFGEGRLGRYWSELESVDTTMPCRYGGTIRSKAGAVGCWVYCLSARRAA